VITNETVEYLEKTSLLLATAESCTAGRIVALLAEVPGSGSLIECGYVVYSPSAKQRLLGVRRETIEHFNLTSIEVAREMAIGVLKDSPRTRRSQPRDYVVRRILTAFLQARSALHGHSKKNQISPYLPASIGSSATG
jgi:hypothetical protein